MVNTPVSVLMGVGTDAAVMADCRAKLAVGRAFRAEIISYGHDGQPLRLEWHIQPFPAAAAPTRFIAVVRDVSELRALEERQARLEALTRTQSRVATAGYDLDALQATCERIGFRSGIIAPLTGGIRTFGVLKVYSARPRAFLDGDLQVLRWASGVLAASLEDAWHHEHERQRRQLLVDALPVLVSYVDRDKCYREVNDAYRQWFGLDRAEIIGRHVRTILGDEAVVDRVLEGVAALLQEEVRDADTVCRWRGEEFAVLLPETGAAEAATLAQRMRQRIGETPFPRGRGHHRQFRHHGTAGRTDPGCVRG